MPKLSQSKVTLVRQEVLDYLLTHERCVKARIAHSITWQGFFEQSRRISFRGDRVSSYPFSEPRLVLDAERRKDKEELGRISNAIAELRNGSVGLAVTLLQENPLLRFGSLTKSFQIVEGNHTDPESCRRRTDFYRSETKRISRWIKVLGS